MGLFDDILKKTQEKTPVDPLTPSGGDTTANSGGTGGSGAIGGNPPADTSNSPIVIQKTAETSLFDLRPTPINTVVVTMQEPNIVQTHAEEAPSILVTTPENIVETPLIMSMEGTPTPEITRDAITPSEGELISSPENNSLFSFEKGEQVPSASLTEAVNDEGSEVMIEKKVEKIIHPKEFIEKSIADIDVMIVDIDTAHASKIHEAEDYGKEKDRIAVLETDAYREATTLDEEKTHALHVRGLLSGELSEGITRSSIAQLPVSVESAVGTSGTDATEDTSGSVESTLAELAVQNTVTETIEARADVSEPREKMSHPKKTQKKEESVTA